LKSIPVLILAAFALLTFIFSACKGAETIVNAPGASTTGLSVSGTGHAFGPPDIILIQLGVQTEARTVGDAREQAASAAQAVIDSVKKNGVDDKDVRTTQFSVQPQYDTSRSGTPTIRGYRVINTLSVKVRKLDNASKVIDDAAAAGGNSTVVNSIAFSIDDPTQLQAVARSDAMKQAKAKADQLAKLGGVSAGKPKSIVEGGAVSPIFTNQAAVSAPRLADTSTPIESGQLDITVTVNVMYEIQ
jgi:uncharacterized protein YggE